jgi:hypothetical protein
MAIRKSCAIHYLEEKTCCHERTRTFDLWAWCCDPTDIPKEVRLTITEPDKELAPPHYDTPTVLKHTHFYNLRNHLEVWRICPSCRVVAGSAGQQTASQSVTWSGAMVLRIRWGNALTEGGLMTVDATWGATRGGTMKTTTTTTGATTTTTVNIAASQAGQGTHAAGVGGRTASAPTGGAQGGSLHQE